MVDEANVRERPDEPADPRDGEADYERDIRLQSPQRSGVGCMLVVCAVFIGFLGARSVAESAGLISLEHAGQGFDRIRGEEGSMILLSGILLALFVFAVFRFLFGLAQRVIAVLERVQTRPPMWSSIAILICGVACLIAAVALQWHASTGSANLAFDMPGMPRGGPGGGIFIRGQSSPMVPITTLGVLLAGLAILAVGIWSSIPPRAAGTPPLANRAQ